MGTLVHRIWVLVHKLGGVRSKLSKGQLHTILHDLPLVESVIQHR